MSRVLHFEFSPGTANWIKRLLARINASLNSELNRRKERWSELTLGEDALALAARMVAIGIAARRLNEELAALGSELIENSHDVEACMREGAVYTPSDGALTYSILVDFDAFLFETRSAYEITVRFIHKFLSGILEKTMPQAKTQAMHDLVAREISRRGGQVDWIQELWCNRNLFIHETAPWPALEVSSVVPLKAELVLLKRNVVDLSQPDAYLHLAQCRGLYTGFQASFAVLEKWLVSEIDDFEARHLEN